MSSDQTSCASNPCDLLTNEIGKLCHTIQWMTENKHGIPQSSLSTLRQLRSKMDQLISELETAKSIDDNNSSISMEKCPKCSSNTIITCTYETEIFCEDAIFTSAGGKKHVHDLNQICTDYECVNAKCRFRFTKQVHDPCPVCPWPNG